MQGSQIAVIVPLAEAGSSSKTGTEARSLSKLARAGFAIPRGFVITSDAFRFHSWSAGVRPGDDPASARDAMLRRDLSADIAEGLAEEYRRLAMQTGLQSPRVLVRASHDSADAFGPGKRLTVADEADLADAVKIIWAAHARDRDSAPAVIVQQEIDSLTSGGASTQGSESVRITCPREFQVSLADPQSELGDDLPIGVELAVLIAERAVMIEDALGFPAEFEWAWDVDRLIISAAGRAAPSTEPSDRRSEAAGEEADPVALSRRTLEAWSREIGPDIRTVCAEAIECDLASVGNGRLLRTLERLIFADASARDWFHRASGSALVARRSLGANLEDVEVSHLVFGSLPESTFSRDIRLQDLALRFAAAEERGLVDHQSWRAEFRADVERLARDFGGAFYAESDTSGRPTGECWIENPDPIYRVIEAARAPSGRQTLLVRLSCAREECARIESEIAKRLSPAERSRFAELLRSARNSVTTACEAEMLLALARAATRLVLTEMGRRLASRGAIPEAGSVFYLTPDELAICFEGGAPTDVAPLVARRKHDEWVSRRRADRLRVASTLHECLPVCSGEVTGRAFCARGPCDAGAVTGKDILIVADACSGWTPFLGVVAGFVAESGPPSLMLEAMLHLHGIPAVVGCAGAMELSGRSVCLDGRAGSVTIRNSMVKSRSKPLTHAQPGGNL